MWDNVRSGSIFKLSLKRYKADGGYFRIIEYNGYQKCFNVFSGPIKVAFVSIVQRIWKYLFVRYSSFSKIYMESIATSIHALYDRICHRCVAFCVLLKLKVSKYKNFL